MTYHTSLATIERTIAAVEARGSEGLAVAADLSRPDQAENAVNQVVARFGRLDALVEHGERLSPDSAGRTSARATMTT